MKIVPLCCCCCCLFLSFLLVFASTSPSPPYFSPIDTTTTRHPLKNNQTFLPHTFFLCLPRIPLIAKIFHFPCLARVVFLP